MYTKPEVEFRKFLQTYFKDIMYTEICIDAENFA